VLIRNKADGAAAAAAGARREYLAGLVAYMESFHARTQPLAALAKIYARLGDFDERFEGGGVPGWEDRGEGPAGASGGGANGSDAPGAIDASAFASVDELETLGAHAPHRPLFAWLFGSFEPQWAVFGSIHGSAALRSRTRQGCADGGSVPLVQIVAEQAALALFTRHKMWGGVRRRARFGLLPRQAPTA
jgi:hypothetical protein